MEIDNKVTQAAQKMWDCTKGKHQYFLWAEMKMWGVRTAAITKSSVPNTKEKGTLNA